MHVFTDQQDFFCFHSCNLAVHPRVREQRNVVCGDEPRLPMLLCLEPVLVCFVVNHLRGVECGGGVGEVGEGGEGRGKLRMIEIVHYFLSWI